MKKTRESLISNINKSSENNINEEINTQEVDALHFGIGGRPRNRVVILTSRQ